MSRLALFVFILCTSLLVVVANPIPSSATTNTESQQEVTYRGRGTWFYPDVGNCGKRNKASDRIVALATSRYANGGHCEQWVHIKNNRNGKSVYSKVRDSCPSCADSDLDMSPATFNVLDNPDIGVIDISWSFMGKGWQP